VRLFAVIAAGEGACVLDVDATDAAVVEAAAVVVAVVVIVAVVGEFASIVTDENSWERI